MEMLELREFSLQIYKNRAMRWFLEDIDDNEFVVFHTKPEPRKDSEECDLTITNLLSKF